MVWRNTIRKVIIVQHVNVNNFLNFTVASNKIQTQHDVPINFAGICKDLCIEMSLRRSNRYRRKSGDQKTSTQSSTSLLLRRSCRNLCFQKFEQLTFILPQLGPVALRHPQFHRNPCHPDKSFGEVTRLEYHSDTRHC